MDLSMLTLQFDQNALKDKNRFELLITDENELSGLPESARDAAAMLAKSKDKDGWLFNLSAPSYIPFMRYSDKRDLREKMYREYMSVGNKGDEFDEFDDAVPQSWEDRNDKIPLWVTLAHVCFLVWTVLFAHEPVMFIGSFLFFIGFTLATPQYQNQMSLRVPIMVGFFLAGLVILGGVQAWWLEPVLTRLGDYAMVGATLLTAFNDNAAVTFLASTVPNLPEAVKYSVVAGAVTGGGLTVIANAPNPAGQAILGKYFKGINPLWLFAWAAFPTAIVFIFFTCFGH